MQVEKLNKVLYFCFKMLIGVVGKPSCGKSTFFKASTLAEVEIALHPFTTINSNHGIGYVKIDCVDSFFNKQCNPRFGYCIDHKRFVPVEMMDVAGLVPGASEGKGMGNAFLDELRQADVLIHVVDISGSTNENGEPVEPLSYNPEKDVEFLENEIDTWFYNILSKSWEKFVRQVKQDKSEIDKAIAKQLSGLKVEEDHVNLAIKKLNLDKENPGSWSDEDVRNLLKELRKSSKPLIIAANKIDVPGAEKNLENLRKKFPDCMIVPCSAESELALKEAHKNNLIKYVPGENDFEILDENSLSEKQKTALSFIKENILKKYKSTGVQDVLNKAVFDLLKYIAIYPGGVNKLEDSDGNVLPDVFLLKEGSTALDFAYRIHTDFGKNFIRAIDVKTKKTIGKDHVLNNGDVVEIISDK